MRTYALLLLGKLIGLLPESRAYGLKAFLYNICGEHIHPRARIYSSVRFATYPVTIGEDTHVGQQCFFTGGIGCPIDIGMNCDIAPGVLFTTGTHGVGSRERRAGTGIALPIRVGAGTWIGARSVILPGVTIGEGCIIAAGSVVTSDVPPNVMVAGVPAVVKKQLEMSDSSGSN